MAHVLQLWLRQHAAAYRRPVRVLVYLFVGVLVYCFRLRTVINRAQLKKKTVNQWKKEEEKEKHKNHKLLPGCPILSLFLSLLLMYCFLSKYDDDDDGGGGGDDDDDDDDDRY